MKNKLTKPQQELKAELDKGRQFATFNAHYANGGEYRFLDNGALVSYKVFWGLQRATGLNEKAVNIGRFCYSWDFWYDNCYYNHFKGTK